MAVICDKQLKTIVTNQIDDKITLMSSSSSSLSSCLESNFNSKVIKVAVISESNSKLKISQPLGRVGTKNYTGNIKKKIVSDVMTN